MLSFICSRSEVEKWGMRFQKLKYWISLINEHYRIFNIKLKLILFNMQQCNLTFSTKNYFCFAECFTSVIFLINVFKPIYHLLLSNLIIILNISKYIEVILKIALLKMVKQDLIHFVDTHPSSQNILQLSVMLLMVAFCYHVNYRYKVS